MKKYVLTTINPEIFLRTLTSNCTMMSWAASTSLHCTTRAFCICKLSSSVIASVCVCVCFIGYNKYMGWAFAAICTSSTTEEHLSLVAKLRCRIIIFIAHQFHYNKPQRIIIIIISERRVHCARVFETFYTPPHFFFFFLFTIVTFLILIFIHTIICVAKS